MWNKTTLDLNTVIKHFIISHSPSEGRGFAFFYLRNDKTLKVNIVRKAVSILINGDGLATCHMWNAANMSAMFYSFNPILFIIMENKETTLLRNSTIEGFRQKTLHFPYISCSLVSRTIAALRSSKVWITFAQT